MRRLQRQNWITWYVFHACTGGFFAHVVFVVQRKAGQRIDEEVVNLPPEVFGRPKAPAGTWASGIRIIDPVEVHRDLIVRFPPSFLTYDPGKNTCNSPFG